MVEHCAQRLDVCVSVDSPLAKIHFIVFLVFELLTSRLMFKNQDAFSMIELMVVIAIIGLLSAIAIPAFMKASLSARQKACVSNLEQVDSAIQQWAIDTKSLPENVVTHTNLLSYLRELPTCPSPAANAGTFATDYGMTFVQEPAFCVANWSLKGTPHIRSSTSVIKNGPKTNAPGTIPPRKPRAPSPSI